nr:InfA [Thladiantha nudiflora]
MYLLEENKFLEICYFELYPYKKRILQVKRLLHLIIRIFVS